MTAEENLARLGITLPAAPPAVANYVAWVRTGNLVVTSGQLPWEGSAMKYTGRLGDELSTEEGYQAARLTTINALAQIREAVGDLEKVVQIVRLEGRIARLEGELRASASSLVDLEAELTAANAWLAAMGEEEKGPRPRAEIMADLRELATEGLDSAMRPHPELTRELAELDEEGIILLAELLDRGNDPERFVAMAFMEKLGPVTLANSSPHWQSRMGSPF